MKNLLDRNGYIESVIRNALAPWGADPKRTEKTDNEKLADEIIERLRGDEDRGP